jgi:hypothetical protein
MKRFLIAALAVFAGVCVAAAQQGPPAGAYGSGAGGGSGGGSGIPYGTGGGTAQAQTVTTTPNITALTTGTYVTWLPTAANTAAAPTLAAGTTAATAITKCGTVALVAGDLLSTVWAVAQYDGTEWVLQNPVQFGCSEGGLPTSGGTANAQTLTVSPAITAYITGVVFNFTPGVANTGATTVAISGLGTKNITKCGTTALVANDLTTTAIAIILYDGTEFQLLNPQATACGSGGGAAGSPVYRYSKTSAPTSITSAGVFSDTLALDGTKLVIGSEIIIDAVGNFSTTATSGNQYGVQVEVAGSGVTQLTGSCTMASATQTNSGWHYHATLTVKTTGSSGTYQGGGELSCLDQQSGANTKSVAFATNSDQTINTTGTVNFQINESLTLSSGTTFTLNTFVTKGVD